MGTPAADKLRHFYASKYLSSDGDTITERVADAGGGLKTIVDAALTEIDDFWNGAIGFFSGDTATVALRAHFFHVRDFDAATDTLTLYKDMPAIPAAGDTFRLILGGNFRGDIELFGLSLDGDLPEEIAVVGTNITGLTIKKVSGKLGIGNLEVFFDFSEDLIFIKLDAGIFGVGLDVSGDVTGGIIFLPDNFGWIEVDVVAASLPGSDQTDNFTTARPERTMTPDFEGLETALNGKTRFRLEVVKNTDATETMVSLGAFTGKAAGTNTNIATAESLSTGEDDADLDAAADWPAASFWVRNTTVNGGLGDCRYVKFRSLNRIFTQAVVWGTLGFDAGVNEIFQGDLIEDPVTGASATVDQIVVTSGSFVGNDAAGVITFRDIAGGTFDNDNDIEVASVVMAVSDGGSVLGMRGLTAVAWSAGDAVEVMPDFDIGLDAPATLQFEDPSPETIAPDGVVFTAPIDQAGALDIGDMAPADIFGVWRREWIVDSPRARDDIDVDIEYFWT